MFEEEISGGGTETAIFASASYHKKLMDDIGDGSRGGGDGGDSYRFTLDEALEEVGFGKFQTLVLAYAGLGWFSEAMEIMILSFIGSAVKSEWGLSSSQESILTTVVFAGMLFGASSWGLVSDNYGRRKGFLSIAVVATGAGFLSTFSPNYLSLVIFRGLVGFGLGGGHVFLSWFLEFVPVSNRGMWMVIFSTFWTFGTIFEASLAWIVMPRLSWRWLLALSSVPSFALLFLYILVPESPRFLCTKGNTSEALKILKKMASMNKTKLPPGILVSCTTSCLEEESVLSENMTSLLSSPMKNIVRSKSAFSTFFMLFSSKLNRTTLLLWMLFFGNSFSYYGLILLTSKLSSEQSGCSRSILSYRNLQSNSLYVDTLITAFAEFPGLLLSAVLVDKIGRKLSMASMFVLELICFLPLLTHQSAVLTTSLLFGARMFSVGTTIIAYIYAPEVYPTHMRSTGSGVASAMGRIGGMICPLVAVGLVTECYQKEAVFLFLGVIVLSTLCIFFFPYETKGQELSDS